MDVKDWILGFLQVAVLALLGLVYRHNENALDACQTQKSCNLIHAQITACLEEMKGERKEIAESLKRIELKLAYQNGCENRRNDYEHGSD